MSDFSSLRIPENGTLTVDKWNEWIGKYGELVTYMNNGLVIKNYNVGIGPGSPTNRLHIYSEINNGGQSPLKIETNFGEIKIGVRDNDWAYFETDSPKFYFNKEIRVKGGKIGAHGGSDLSFTTSGGDMKMVIKKEGNVGVGEENPKVKLHIYSEILKSGEAPLKIQTNFGYVNIGSRNKDWAHIETDRSRFYFDKGIRINSGEIGSYSGYDLRFLTDNDALKMIVKRNGNIGIGVESPKAKLHIGPGGGEWSTWEKDDSLYNYTWQKSIYMEAGNALMFDSGDGPFVIGARNTKGSRNKTMGARLIVSTNSKPAIFINKHAEVELTGGLRVEGNIEYYSSLKKDSDIRLKQDIINLPKILDKFVNLNPVIYRYKNILGHNSNELHTGLIAQEVEKLFPYLISKEMIDNDELDSKEILKIKTSSIVYYTIAAIIELNEKVEQLKTELLQIENT